MTIVRMVLELHHGKLPLSCGITSALCLEICRIPARTKSVCVCRSLRLRPEFQHFSQVWNLTCEN